MARTKADFEGLKVQEFLTKAQAMAYTLRKTPESFDEEIAPYVNLYEAGKGGCYYVPELRKRMLSLFVVKSKM